jgi:hypothetical protein
MVIGVEINSRQFPWVISGKLTLPQTNPMGEGMSCPKASRALKTSSVHICSAIDQPTTRRKNEVILLGV